jgi:AcrR family transcriptional regulator
MAEVSRRAGVSSGLTLYYFRTKQHLVQALARRLLHRRLVSPLRPRLLAGMTKLAVVIDVLLQADVEEPRIIAMHLALVLQPRVAELLVDTEHYLEEQLVCTPAGYSCRSR